MPFANDAADRFDAPHIAFVRHFIATETRMRKVCAENIQPNFRAVEFHGAFDKMIVHRSPRSRTGFDTHTMTERTHAIAVTPIACAPKRHGKTHEIIPAAVPRSNQRELIEIPQ